MQRCEGVEVSGEVWHKKHLLHQYFLTAVATLHVFFSTKTPTISQSSNHTAGAQIHNCVHCKLAQWPCMHGLWHHPLPAPHRRHFFWCKAVVDGSGFALTRLPACRAICLFLTCVPCVEFLRRANEARFTRILQLILHASTYMTNPNMLLCMHNAQVQMHRALLNTTAQSRCHAMTLLANLQTLCQASASKGKWKLFSLRFNNHLKNTIKWMRVITCKTSWKIKLS